MTAQKFYKCGTITAEPFGRDGWLMRESFLMPYVVSNEALKEHFAPLPVIPKAVGEFIKIAKSTKMNLYQAMRYIQSPMNKYYEWAVENDPDTFARAWLDGYRIEEEVHE